MSQVFLSYRTEDLSAVHELADHLRKRCFDVWMDKHRITGGTQWIQGLEQAIESNYAFMLLLGQFGASEWQRKEFDYALHLAVHGTNRPIIPVLLPNGPDPGSLTGFLALFQAIDLRNGYQPNSENFARLCLAITGRQPFGPYATIAALASEVTRLEGHRDRQLNLGVTSEAERLLELILKLIHHDEAPRSETKVYLGSGATLAGKYELQECMGSGAFCGIWLATDIASNRHVVLRILSNDQRHSAKVRSDFRAGAKIQHGLSHSGIVRVFDIVHGDDDGYLFYPIEYMPGGDLYSAVKSGRLTLTQRMTTIRDIGVALGFLHERGYVHRDVNPRNILLDADGKARLADFDLIKREYEGRSSTLFGQIGYLAPEYFGIAGSGRDERTSKTERALDVFGLGATAAFVLTGNEPSADFPGDQSILDSIEDVWLRSVVARACHRSSGGRYHTMPEFLVALDSALSKGVALRAIGDLTRQARSYDFKPMEPYEGVVGGLRSSIAEATREMQRQAKATLRVTYATQAEKELEALKYIDYLVGRSDPRWRSPFEAAVRAARSKASNVEILETFADAA